MKLARYRSGGVIAIEDEPLPSCPPGGLLVRTEASGLCTGELMAWYMDQKAPHVIGHEVAGIVVESEDARFPVGSRVVPHHHAPCLSCDVCRSGAPVHCPTWKATKLIPGGMAESFAVPFENLLDAHLADDLRPVDAALAEPLACVMKGFTRSGARIGRETRKTAVIGLGVMGVMHALLLPGAVCYEINPKRREWATNLGIDAREPEQTEPAQLIFVCPGSEKALEQAARMAMPDATIVLFAPMPPGRKAEVDLHPLYFLDAKLINSYSCGPDDMRAAMELLRDGKIKAEQVVSDFVALSDLPAAYQAMKQGEILKAMVVFD